MATQTRQATNESRSRGMQGGRGKASSGQTGTGERDQNYDLVSVLYHALQGAETCQQYIKDAKRGSDPELARFFEEVRDEQVRLAAKARHLLASRLEDEMEEEEDEDEDELEEDED